MTGFDLIVLGAGPGGYTAAIKAAKLGMSVAIIEKDSAGGTCLNRGCVPTKALLHSAHIYREAANSGYCGISVQNVGFDYRAMLAHKDDTVAALRSGVEKLLDANGVLRIAGSGRVTSPHTVSVGGDEYRAENIIIATGGEPYVPPISGCGLDGVVTSDELLREPRLYDRIAIIGGGVIGMEFAGLYNALGREVTVIEAQPRILPLMDREISQNLSLIMKKRGVSVFTGAAVKEIKQNGAGLEVCFATAKGEESVCANGVLVAVGRKSVAGSVADDSVGLRLERGCIPVDEAFRTNIPSIRAIGDVVAGGVQLAHAASAQGENAVCSILGLPFERNLAAIPSCVYTDPEIACVGITEAEAKERGMAVRTGKYLMSGNARSMIGQSERGFVKLVADAENDELVGAQLMCERASDMIGELALAIANRLTAGDIVSAVHPHPTFSEGVCEAAGELLGKGVNTMPKRPRG